MTYALKKATVGLGRIRSENPALAGEVLAEIRRRCGDITPERVVDESRDPGAPLHDFFEWDNSVAGEKYRQQQAAYLIRHVITDEVSTEPVRAFIHVSFDDDSGDMKVGQYVPITEVLDDESMRSQMLTRALSELKAWERKYAALAELDRVRSAAAELYEKHEKSAA